MLASGKGTDAPAKSVAEGIAFCRNLFDWSVAQSEEASVALYTFGNPAILDAATTEIVDFLRRVKVVGSDLDLLEIGCGTGRFQEALARELNSITGIDVSTGMLAVARERCAGLPNVTLAACSGLDLGMFPDASFDVALGVDSFPYLYQSGMALVERHFAEIARVLRPRGTLVILEFSYRGDADADRREIGRLAAEFGFTVTLNGSSPFRIWDGTAFVLVRNSG